MNSADAWLASSSVSRVTPYMYMVTMRCDQSSSCGAISTGRPSISAMMMIGIGAAIGWQQIDLAVGRKAVDQLVGEPLDARPQLLDLARHEGAVDQRPQPRMGRRLELQHRIGLDARRRRRDARGPAGAAAVGNAGRDLAAEALVAQQPADVVEAAKTPVAVILPEEGGRMSACSQA